VKFFIDECLSPSLARRLNALGLDAFHPPDVGRRGEPDHVVLQRCIEEDRILVTENAGDFRRLVGRVEMHPGMIILPAIDKEGAWHLMQSILTGLDGKTDPRDFMFSRVVAVAEDGTIRVHRLPPLG
jgi:predicted nuclease of predicted toxin-antitoxin system